MKWLNLFFTVILLTSFSACSSCDSHPEDNQEEFSDIFEDEFDDQDSGVSFPNCGQANRWDRDGDRLSDRVEQNNAVEGYHDFSNNKCDPDPSRADGSYSDGQLRGGINLPDSGNGYEHNYGSDGVDEDDWGTAKAISCIENVGRLWAGSGVKLGINDISKKNGGRFSGHSSHQIGLDIDVRYIRKDGINSPLHIVQTPRDYDSASSKSLIEDFVQSCDVQLVFVDIDKVGFDVVSESGNTILYDAPGHSNHFHVRLNPDEG